MKSLFVNRFLAAALMLLFAAAPVMAKSGVTKANYALAERFSSKKIGKLLFSTDIKPNWFKNSDKFWYSFKTTKGTEYYIVDPQLGTKKKLWDMAVIAAKVSEIVLDPFDAQHLPIKNMELKDDSYFTFEITSTLPEDKKEDKTKKGEGAKKEDASKKGGKKVFKFKYEIASGKLTDITGQEEKKVTKYWAAISPDGKYAVYRKNYNLFCMDSTNYWKAMEDEKDSTIVEHRLTWDGTADFAYGRGFWDRSEQTDSTKREPAEGLVWSPDSKHFAVTRIDKRDIKELWVINSTANPRPKLETYKYLMPGEPGATTHLYLFNIEERKGKTINVAAFKDQSISIEREPRNNKVRYEREKNKPVWLGDEKMFIIERQSRDLKRVDVCTVNIDEDSCRVLFKERLNTYVETRELRRVNGGKEYIWWSERDGWAHLYLYGADGKVKNRITQGDFHVDRVVGVDEARRVVYFTANGREKDENPYYSHLYSANFDGSGIKLLNKGNYDTKVIMPDDAKYFISTYSRADVAPKMALYDNTGRKIMELEETDLSALLAYGYKYPELFTVKAADGITDLYGVLYKPFDFDSTKVYPIIEYVYPGPQTEAVNSSWSASMTRVDRLAQLGFIVVTVGNRGGHPNRSKWYHNFGYGNLRDYGLEDKKFAVQQLAARYPYMDIKRVGIHGHSGGGFMSTAALLYYPHFFKAAVSCSGNHDNNIYNNWWSEQHHGLLESVNAKGDTTFKISIPTNQSLAKQLEGHLLLVTGDLDNNVHPANTIRVVDALIKANKRFDMLIIPGERHGYQSTNEYFFWKMADHFCRYLIGDWETSTNITQMFND